MLRARRSKILLEGLFVSMLCRIALSSSITACALLVRYVCDW